MRTKLLLLLSVLSLQAQVGIGTKTPQSMLDVKGDIRIGNEGKTDKQGKAGMLRWSDAGACLEAHDGEKWGCSNPTNSLKAHQTLLLTASGSGILRFDNGKGWANAEEGRVSSQVIEFSKAEGIGKNLYKPYTGTIRIQEEGLYRISYNAKLLNHPPGGAFDGDSGDFITWLTLNYDEHISAFIHNNVFRGRRVYNGLAYYQNNDSTIVYLKKNDEVHLRFITYGTPNMNTDTKNIYIDKDQSWIKLWKL